MEITGIKNRIKKEQKPSRTYLYYTFLFGFLCLVIFSVFLQSNKSFIWQGDGARQHYTFLYHYYQIIKNLWHNGFPMLSWNMGLGLDTIGQYSYYVVGDPFVYLSLLFPIRHLETTYNMLVILRMYCIGLAFIAYCKYCKKNMTSTLLGAMIYTFCGFVLYSGVRHPYFLNALILLPLNLIGVEKLLKEDKKSFFTFMIFISAVVNYYFFYMITVVDLLYAVIKYNVQYNQGIKIFFKKLMSAGVCYLTGVLMASIIFMPTIYSFLNSARTECVQPKIYLPAYYQYLWLGIVCLRFKNWSVIAVASVVILMLPIVFSKWKAKEAKAYSILWLVTTGMLLFPQIGSMMNGFSFPSNRWVFAYCFILAYIVTICFDRKLEYTKQQKRYMLVGLVVYALVGVMITKGKVIKNMDYYVQMLIAVMLWGVMAFPYKKERQKFYANIAVLGLSCMSILVNAFALYTPIGNNYVEEFIPNNEIDNIYATANNNIQHYAEAIQYLKTIDKSFYRISNSDNRYQNLSLIYDYHPIELYLSLGNKHVYSLSERLEDRCYTPTKCVNGADGRTKMMTLLANKYYICSKKDAGQVPYGYELIHEIEDAQIYRNKNYLPIGVLYNQCITPEQFQALSPLEREDALLTMAMVEDTVGADDSVCPMRNNNKEKIQTPIILDYTVQDANIRKNSITTTQKNQKVTLSLENIPNNAELYVYIENIHYQTKRLNDSDFKISAKIDEIKTSEDLKNCITSAYYMDKKDFLMNLGDTNKINKKEIALTFNKKGKYTFDNLKILAVPMKQYEAKVKAFNKMENIQYGNNYLSGEVTTKQDGILQITTSYSDGWKAYVDGKEVELLRVNEAFIGCKVEAGTHKVEFRYTTPYLKLGAICSVVGMLLFNFVLWRERRN